MIGNIFKIIVMTAGIFAFLTIKLQSGVYSEDDFPNSKKLYENESFGLVLDSYNEDNMEIADGWSNKGMFNCVWNADNVKFNDGIMNLTIDKNKIDTSYPYSAGEYRSKNYFAYGLYKVCMKPIKNNGVVTSFFTYTGKEDKTQWDEIDIEFLGKDTSKVQFNYFNNGVGKHEYIYDLGFDASDDFHTYGFLWMKDLIVWYVDNVPVYRVTEDIPVTPGKIMMNVWPGIGKDTWLNKYDGKVPLIAEYKWASYTRMYY